METSNKKSSNVRNTPTRRSGWTAGGGFNDLMRAHLEGLVCDRTVKLFHVLAALADRNTAVVANVSRDQLKAVTGFTDRKHLTAALNWLVANGYVEWDQGKGGRSTGCAVYRVAGVGPQPHDFRAEPGPLTQLERGRTGGRFADPDALKPKPKKQRKQGVRATPLWDDDEPFDQTEKGESQQPHFNPETGGPSSPAHLDRVDGGGGTEAVKRGGAQGVENVKGQGGSDQGVALARDDQYVEEDELLSFIHRLLPLLLDDDLAQPLLLAAGNGYRDRLFGALASAVLLLHHEDVLAAAARAVNADESGRPVDALLAALDDPNAAFRVS